MSLGKSESSSSPSSVWNVQSPYLQALYQGAFGLSGGQTTTTPGKTSMDWNPNAVTPGGQAYDYAQGIGQGAAGGFGAMLGGGYQNPQAAQGFSQMAQSGGNPYLMGSIGAGLGEINRNFQRNILPGINTGAAMTNTSGGSRQGIAQGLAASDANRQAGDFVNKMLSGNFQQTMQNRLAGLQGLSGIDAMRNQMLGQGVSMAPDLANLGLAPTQAFWQERFSPLQALGNILGPPAVLGGGSSSSGWNVGIGEN